MGYKSFCQYEHALIFLLRIALKSIICHHHITDSVPVLNQKKYSFLGVIPDRPERLCLPLLIYREAFPMSLKRGHLFSALS